MRAGFATTGAGGTAGIGGGGLGQGANQSGTPGGANTGGGGGGEHGTAQNGQAGGSGVVVLRIPDSFSANFSAGVVYQLNTAGGYKTYTVTSAASGQTVTFSS